MDEEVYASSYIKGLRDGKEIGYQKGREDALRECKRLTRVCSDKEEMRHEISIALEQMKEKKDD